ncbi:hypothetical protein POF50_009180 [Streptomyces sp. SL13]|uniref:DUF461 domain-containing protein n=1 Tax=Streptantibioticus silvisoli TaxID=2705255 RepID=A0AA90H3D3_9ACTN|nr:hypothetical protein [Streptantibioticus silvisoli]MDI5969512.1 hypothetical protein [Streptantibioticus silvisoli]
MSSSLRRGVLAAVITLSIAPLAAACGVGQDPQSLEVKPDSVATTVGDIEIQNAFIITEPQGSGAAVFTGRVFNNSTSAQQLTSITVQGSAAQAKLTGADGKAGPITIPANGSVALGGKGNPVAELSGSQGLDVGGFQKAVLDFSSTGQVTVDPAVVPAEHYFAPYGPSVEATPSTAALPSTLPSGSASAPAGAVSGAPSASTTAKAGKPGTVTAKPSKAGAKPGKGAQSELPVSSKSPKA